MVAAPPGNGSESSYRLEKVEAGLEEVRKDIRDHHRRINETVGGAHGLMQLDTKIDKLTEKMEKGFGQMRLLLAEVRAEFHGYREAVEEANGKV